MKYRFLILLFLLPFIRVLAQQTDEQLATQYFGNREYGKAAELYERLISRNPGSVYIYDNLLSCYISLQQFDEAEKLVKKQQRRYSENAFYKVDLGFVYAKSGKQDKAIKYYDELFKHFKGTDHQTTELANAFLKRNDRERALNTYLSARKLNRNPTLYAVSLAQLYAQSRDTKKVIDEYLNALSNNENILDEVEDYLQLYLQEPGDFDMLKSAALKKEKETPSGVYSELLVWLYVQRKDYANAFIQAKAIDKRNNENGRRLIDLAGLAMSNAKYDEALTIYQYVVQMGNNKPLYLNGRMGVLEARRTKIFSGMKVTPEEMQALKHDYELFLTEEGRNDFTASTQRELARLEVYHMHLENDGIKLFQELIEMPRMNNRFRAECKLELGDIMVFRNEVWDAVLLYGQVDKDFLEDPLGQEAKFRNARLSYYIGEFEWARAQLDVLKTATSQLIANNALELSLLIQDNTQDSLEEPLLMFARADLNYFQQRQDIALQILDSINQKFPKHSLDDDILFKRAQIWVKKNDALKANSYLDQLLKEHGSDILGDNALLMLADITEHQLNDKEKAKSLYEKFIQDYPGSFFLPEVRKRFRTLRGDILE